MLCSDLSGHHCQGSGTTSAHWRGPPSTVTGKLPCYVAAVGEASECQELGLAAHS